MPSIFGITMALEGGPEVAGGGSGAGAGGGGGAGDEDGLELEGGGGGGGATFVVAAVGLGDPPQPARMKKQEIHIRSERAANDLEILTNKLRELN